MYKIAIVYDHELDIGGVETHLLALFRNIDHDRYTYVLISPMSERFMGKAISLGARALRYRSIRPLDLRVSFDLVRLFQYEKIDLVHVQSPTAAIHARLAAKYLNLPSIVSVHLPASDYHGMSESLRARSGRWLYTTIDRIHNFYLTSMLIYVSKYVRDNQVARRLSPAPKSIVIPNGIDLSLYLRNGARDKLRSQYGISPEKNIFCFIGRLDEQKGVDLLIEAAAQTSPDIRNNFVMWFIGEGPKGKELQNKTRDFGLEDTIQFMGFQEAIPDFLQASDVFILPSRYEAMPISILEAMAAGLPCIVTDVGENAALVENSVHGIVVPPNSPHILAEAIETLINNPGLIKEMGANARKKSASFSDVQMVAQIEDVYKTLLG